MVLKFDYTNLSITDELQVHNNLIELYAPLVTEIGDQAFLGCYSLAKLYAPKLEKIGSAALAYTAVTEFEVFDSLQSVGSSVFEGCENFATFFTTVDGEKVFDKEYDGVMIKDGVLYTVMDNGYNLSVYPMAKTDEIFEVAPGTVRIEYCAAIGNASVKRVVLPESLRYIGNHAFYKCTSLETVVFKSYYAPILEGTLTGSQIEITKENVDQYPGFDSLYKYDYYFRIDGKINAPYYYSNFVGAIASADAMDLTYVIPENNSGYDTKIYKAYFNASETETSGVVMGPYAVAFVDAVNKLPTVADRFDEELIVAAINAYNALEGRSDIEFIDEALIERFLKARSEYNVSVVENKIAHLFDMDNSKYSFDRVKDARAAYLALTEKERSMVSNAMVLENKISDLSAIMGVNPDFSIDYEAHFPDAPDAPDDPADPGSQGKDSSTLVIVIIISASVLVAASAAFAVVLFLKKKKVSE